MSTEETRSNESFETRSNGSGTSGHGYGTYNDPHSVRSSWYASVFLVVNAALGAGLLNFPAAYDQSGGIWIAIGIQAILMVFIVVAMMILLYCSDIHQSATYQDVIYSLCGKKMQMTCAATVALYCFGTCVTFFIIIADQWDKFLTFAYGPSYCLHWYMTRQFTLVLTCLLLVLPICFSRRIDFLKYPSAVGVVVVIYVVILVTVKYFVESSNPGPIKTKPTHWTDIFIVVPVICFAYQCHLSIVPIYACMRKRTITEFSKTLSVALILCIFSYTGTASFGYLTFGSDVKQDILESYKPTPDVLVAVIGLAAKMYTTYPILMFVGRSALDNIYVYVFKLSPEDIAQKENSRRIVMTILWFGVSLLLAVIVPNIGVVIALLGGLAAVFVFIFPGHCLLKLVIRGYITREEAPFKYYSFLIFSILFIILGAFIFGVITTQAIMNNVQGSHKQITPSQC
ncbi:hypothetical protein LSH36_348g02011 [Paralvinella palmiformis]|uniref:Amino acid transporter transmembrane domain-containing protein n=1 Tax=Paralvinella palmiformis TaxID=53620 RepID=A0AAD9JEV3_9ANNE|nr:hypothetical protein LSH36_348g02011 [Paralvinella palmiformis]